MTTETPIPPGTSLSLATEPSHEIGLGAQDIIEASQPVDFVVSIGQVIDNGSIFSYSVHIDSSLTKLNIQKRTVIVTLCDPNESQCSRSFQSIMFGIEPPR